MYIPPTSRLRTVRTLLPQATVVAEQWGVLGNVEELGTGLVLRVVQQIDHVGELLDVEDQSVRCKDMSYELSVPVASADAPSISTRAIARASSRATNCR